ncbi:hypothetical protein [Streptomyces sp. S.PB5]|uniref:hypothetical protein n=1 Tax=Streptomyces sp. S.PB5 TaxID=3020844 RepID=UPI0025B0A413|nr:hypothetical protein [Streptomyces sp. S.PB5]MDN3025886.1 hypothetical protein [Streptomyces sp. S.PB5]
MTGEDTVRREGLDAELEDLAARCAGWLAEERDRIEQRLRREYERDTGNTAGRIRGGTAADTPRPDAPAAAEPLIGLLDRLAELPAVGSATEPAESADGQVGDAVLDWVRRRVLAALAATGVTPVEDTGTVDPTRHNVVATRADPSGLRCGAIAETVRPGYLWGQAMLRHQEVVAYVPPPKPGSTPGASPAPADDPPDDPPDDQEGGAPDDDDPR